MERALSGPRARRGAGWRDHVTVVPGGRGPGTPDQEQRDRARARLAVPGAQVVVVLGCTVGAGQSVTTLMLADVLATVRAEPVAALDLNPGAPSLAALAGAPAARVPPLPAEGAPGSPARPGPADRPPRGGRTRARLDVFAQDPETATGGAGQEALVAALAQRYTLTLADPGAAAVARMTAVADQLVLVAPASPDAARSLAMTREWLDANGRGALSAAAIAVVNGVSKRSASHAEQAEAVVRGRCRAIVRVPWDDHLGSTRIQQEIRDCRAGAVQSPSQRLRPQVRLAYVALAGVLVSSLAGAPSPGADPR